MSRETYAKQTDGAKAFWPSIVVARTPLPFVITSYSLFRMRHMYVASIRLDFHKEWMEYTEGNLITRVWIFYHS